MQKARSHPKAPTACKRTVSGTISLPCSGYFSPFPHGTCSLSVSQEYLALPDGSGRFRQDYTCPALLRILLGIKIFRVRDYHPLWLNFPEDSTIILKSTLQSYNPNIAETMLVWAIPRSLAATRGITIVFFSSRYLDVSVPWVSFHRRITGLQPAGLPHSEIYGLKVFALTVAYRSLSRPSSPLRAKASAMRP